MFITLKHKNDPVLKYFTVPLLLIICCSLAEAQQQEKSGDLIIKSIYFGGGSYYVTPDQAGELENFIKEFPNLEHYQIIIFSHTDNIGGREYNEWLSKMRSAEVYNLILRVPVPEQQIEIRDFGMENPLYSNQKHLGRRANRRVDVILVPVVF